MAEQWETVQSRASRKAPKSTSNGAPKKAFELEAVKGLVFEEKSQYEVLTPKEKNAPTKETANASAKPKSSIPRPLNKSSSKKPKSPTLETAVTLIDGSYFEEMYSRHQERFKDNPLFCLKEMTSQLNAKLDTVQQSDYTFADCAEDFPSSLLKPDVRKVLNKSIRECSADMLEVFLEQLVQSSLAEMSKGTPVYGYQMVVQLLAKCKPELSSHISDKYLTTVINNKNMPAKCLLLMWMLGQGGSHHFKTGLKVWVSLMLPLIGIKSLAPYSVTYLGDILRKTGSKIEQGYNVVEMKDYFLFLDGVFTSNKNVPAQLQKKLIDYYPVFKKLAFGKTPKDMHRFFPSFLARLNTEQPNADLQKELLDCITFCLVTDAHCLTLWKDNLYLSHLAQSSVVLDHLATNWQENTSLGLKYKLVRQMVAEFTIMNGKVNKSAPGLEACVLACSRFEEVHTTNAEKSQSTAKLLIGLVLLSFSAVLTFDIYSSGGFRESRSGRFLKDTGTDVVIYRLYSQLSLFAYKAFTFLFSNVPVWLEAAIIYCEPVLDTMWNYATFVLTYIMELTAPARSWIVENVPYFIDWVVMHPGWTVIYKFLMNIQQLLQPYIDIILYYISPLLNRVKALLF